MVDMGPKWNSQANPGTDAGISLIYGVIQWLLALIRLAQPLGTEA